MGSLGMEPGDRDANEMLPECHGLRQVTAALRQDCADLRRILNEGFTEMRGRFDEMIAGIDEISNQIRTGLIARASDRARNSDVTHLYSPPSEQQ